MKFLQKLLGTIMLVLFPKEKGQNDVKKDMLFSCEARLYHLWKQITIFYDDLYLLGIRMQLSSVKRIN